jgi:PAS domain-containing protein
VGHELSPHTVGYGLAIFQLDEHGIVVSWDPGAQRIKDYKPDEIIGQYFSRFYTDEDRVADVPARVLRQAAETGALRGRRVSRPKRRHEVLCVRRNRSHP